MKVKDQNKSKDFLKDKFDVLETITNELEEATQPLEHLIGRYEEGMKIVQETKQFIKKMEGRIIDVVEQQKNN